MSEIIILKAPEGELKFRVETGWDQDKQSLRLRVQIIGFDESKGLKMWEKKSDKWISNEIKKIAKNKKED